MIKVLGGSHVKTTMDQNSQNVVWIKADQLLKNRLAYLNSDAIFEFLGQF